jgi:hypothetical protein
MMIRILLAALCACASLAFPPKSVAQASSMKAPVEGLVDMQDISFYRKGVEPEFTLNNVNQFPAQFGGIVLNVTWQQLQPTQSGPLVTAPIDAALGLVSAYNSQNSVPLAIKLRLWGGFMAPDWAKNLAGGPVAIPSLVHGGLPETLGRYWTQPYRQAWQALQSQLAERYDAQSLIREVSVTSCAWATDEPFVQWIAPGNTGPNFANLAAAGYTAAKEFDCLQNARSDYAGWKTTYLDFPFNPLQMYLPAKDTGNIQGCQHVTSGNLRFCNLEEPSAVVMFDCWQSKKCILSNQALATTTTNKTFPYNVIQTIYNVDPDVPIDFQTASPQFVNGAPALCATVLAARTTFHAKSVELWPAAFTLLNAQQIATLASVMNGQDSCGAAIKSRSTSQRP